MIDTNEGYKRLEYFSLNVAADSRRKEFDIKNHSLIYSNNRPDFVFIGDSITHYWELNNYFHSSDKLIVNRGIGGDTTTYLKERFFVDVIQLKPKYCVMGIGINDSIDLEGDYWKRLEPKSYNDVLDLAKNNILDIVKTVIKTDIDLIITSILPIDIPISLNEENRLKYINDMNICFKQISNEYNLIFVDYYSELLDKETKRIKKGTTYDGLHPNALGYEIMTNVLIKSLQEKNIKI